MKFFRALKNRAETDTPVFIIGTQKSGTTWLRDCLDPFVSFCVPEWYFPEMIEAVTAWGNTYATQVDREANVARVQAGIRKMWQEVMGPHRGEKSAYPCALATVRTDIHPRAVSILRSSFPDCRIAVIVRDPRAVYNSLCHYVDGFRPGWSEEIDIIQFATVWADQNRKWADSKPDVVVRYEDLKNEFSESLDRVLTAMKIDHSEQDVKRVHEQVYPIHLLKPKQPEIYRSGLIDEWRTKVQSEKARRIEELAGDAMTEFGYTIG